MRWEWTGLASGAGGVGGGGPRRGADRSSRDRGPAAGYSDGTPPHAVPTDLVADSDSDGGAARAIRRHLAPPEPVIGGLNFEFKPDSRDQRPFDQFESVVAGPGAMRSRDSRLRTFGVATVATLVGSTLPGGWGGGPLLLVDLLQESA